jgi:hypothetical protein
MDFKNAYDSIRREVQYNLGNPTYMGLRYHQITERNESLEKV